MRKVKQGKSIESDGDANLNKGSWGASQKRWSMSRDLQSYADISAEHPGGEKSRCKGPEVRLWDSKEAIVAKWRKRGGEWEEVTMAGLQRALGKSFGSYPG